MSNSYKMEQILETVFESQNDWQIDQKAGTYNSTYVMESDK